MNAWLKDRAKNARQIKASLLAWWTITHAFAVKRYKIAQEWKRGLIRDMLLTLTEAFFVLAISYIPFVLMTIDHFLSNEQAHFDFETSIGLAKTFVRPGEILVYIAGILGSTTSYFIVKILFSPKRRVEYFLCTMIPFALIWISTPIFMADRYNKIANLGFALQIGAGLGSVAILIWLYSILMQRRDFPIEVSGNAASDKIVKEIMGEA
ncbi:MAG: hypothetical protein AB7E55_13740 [Pigmentiphaga sp.]